MTTFLGAPVIARGTVYGNIYLTDKHGGEAFDEQDEEALVVLAAQAGIAIENARLYEESQARQRWLAAVRRDRQRDPLGARSRRGAPAGDVAGAPSWSAPTSHGS